MNLMKLLHKRINISLIAFNFGANYSYTEITNSQHIAHPEAATAQ